MDTAGICDGSRLTMSDMNGFVIIVSPKFPFSYRQTTNLHAHITHTTHGGREREGGRKGGGEKEEGQGFGDERRGTVEGRCKKLRFPT